MAERRWYNRAPRRFYRAVDTWRGSPRTGHCYFRPACILLIKAARI